MGNKEKIEKATSIQFLYIENLKKELRELGVGFNYDTEEVKTKEEAMILIQDLLDAKKNLPTKPQLDFIW